MQHHEHFQRWTKRCLAQQLVLIALFMNLNLSGYMTKSHFESNTNSKVFQTGYISPYGGYILTDCHMIKHLHTPIRNMCHEMCLYKRAFSFSQHKSNMHNKKIYQQVFMLFPYRDQGVQHALSEAIGSLGCRRNSSDGSMLIRQLTELELLTCSRTEDSAGIPVHSAGYYLSPLSLCS